MSKFKIKKIKTTVVGKT